MELARQLAKWGPEERADLKRALAQVRRGAALHAEGKAGEALAGLKEAVGILERLLEGQALHATGLNNLAEVYRDLGDYKAALPLLEKALAIQEKTLGQKHPARATSLHNLAGLRLAMGAHEAALDLYRRALALTEEVLGRDHPDYAQSMRALGMLHHEMGHHRAALPLLRRAVALERRAFGETHPRHAKAMDALASLYHDMGDHEAALPLYRRALAIRKAALGERHPDHLAGLNNLAILLLHMGDLKAALPLAERVLALARGVHGERHPLYASALNNLAFLRLAMGDNKAALPLYERALAIRKRALGERHPEYAAGLNNLALAHMGAGDYKAALPLFEKALEVQKAALGRGHPNEATCLGNLARLHGLMGQNEAALPLAEEALSTVAARLRDLAAVQSDRQQLAAYQAVRAGLWMRLSIPDAAKHPPAYAHVLAWKGALLVRQQDRRLFLRLSSDAGTRAAAEALRSATFRLAALRQSPSATRERLDELARGQEDAQAELSRLSAAFRAQREKARPSPEALAGSLPEGAVLVDYLYYRRDLHDEKSGRPRAEARLAAFVTRKGRPAARVELGPAQDIEAAAAEWRAELMRGKAGAAVGGRLKRLIWSPLQKHLEGARVVLVSPDGTLGTVPLAALPGEKAGTYLIEDVAVAVVPVPQALPEMMKEVPEGKRLGPSLLVVCDVDHEAAKGPGGVVGRRGAPPGVKRGWAKLEGTFAEGAAVTRAFTGLFEGGSVTDLSRAKATKAAVRAALPRARYAPFATHGFFAPKVAEAASPQGQLGREGGRGWHPLLLSGLVLSGANREPREGEEDGILTALEVSEMDLTRLELAVLSACETGLGKVAGGEGILGMQRAFQAAGARTVIASLWKVDDRATQQLMGDFYRVAWDPDRVVSRAEALRQAQLSMLREGRRRGVGLKAEKIEGKGGRLPPYYWAAFVLSGDWR
jgi:CHAT domain-containing protein